MFYIFINMAENNFFNLIKYKLILILICLNSFYISSQKLISSKLEIYDIYNEKRKVVLEEKNHLEAPNWLNENELIYNSNGLIYRYNFKTKQKTKIFTGFANNCNNDHGIFPNGKELIISNNDKDPNSKNSWGVSRIYRVPLEGGTPELITPKGHSFWHGISPDGESILYTAFRNEEADVYKMNLSDKKEIRLTYESGLDDGPEYSHDGKHIYYNSIASGKMEIWKMDKDGKNKIPLTNDKYSNWFPHPSPDGKHLVFISYITDQGDKHPPLKEVMLRLMDLKSLKIKKLFEFIGGQGTINVPSWSKDSKKFAFVSYTKD